MTRKIIDVIINLSNEREVNKIKTNFEKLKKWLERAEDYERIVLKANILGGLNSYILGLGDENILEPWLMCGVPDGCTEEELMEIAEDDDEFRRIAKTFAKLI